MPFSPLSDLVFSVLISPAAGAAGYQVERADTTLNQRAIMKDVVSGLQRADLVIADLTGRNANVFYELGLAHALARPTVLLAQSTEDIPFDLGAYRTVIYSIDFTERTQLTDTLSAQLTPILGAARRGEIVFGSPFSDFAEAPTPADTEGEEPEVGLLDQVLRLQTEDMPRFNAVMESLTQIMTEMTEAQTPVIAALGSPPPGQELAHALAMSAQLGVIFEAHSGRLEKAESEELAPLILSIEKGVIAIYRLAAMSDDREQVETVQGSLQELASAARTSAAQSRELAKMIRRNSRFASSLVGPGRRLATVLERIATGIDRIAVLPETLGLDPSGKPAAR